jgi:hypothetical protein
MALNAPRYTIENLGFRGPNDVGEAIDVVSIRPQKKSQLCHKSSFSSVSDTVGIFSIIVYHTFPLKCKNQQNYQSTKICLHKGTIKGR